MNKEEFLKCNPGFHQLTKEDEKELAKIEKEVEKSVKIMLLGPQSKRRWWNIFG